MNERKVRREGNKKKVKEKKEKQCSEIKWHRSVKVEVEVEVKVKVEDEIVKNMKELRGTDK